MQNKILSTIFLDVYNNLQTFNNKVKISIEDYPLLEQTLENYLVDILGYKIKYNYEDNFREIRKYFENIIYNSKNKNYANLIDCINIYKEEFIEKLESHKYVSLFIETMEKMYSKSYKGKILFDKKEDLNYSSIAISNKGDSFVIGRITRKGDNPLPSVYINNIDDFEISLKKYIEALFMSDSFYNLFANKNFDNISFEDKVKTIFECTIFNATGTDLNNIENFFRVYTDFITDKTFENIRRPSYIAELFDDELYVMSKRSEIEYETPYYLAFMLKNKRVELPNVRLGIETKNKEKVAHIIATQSAQTVLDRDKLNKIQAEIKNNLPTDPYFRFYNPTHLISLLMTFGMLNGMEIKNIDVKDFLPFRYNKTILDKQMSLEEADNYQTRLTNKNLITYMRLAELIDGINIASYPEMDMGLKIRLNDEIKCKNSFLQNIYDVAYEFGKNNKINFNNERRM